MWTNTRQCYGRSFGSSRDRAARTWIRDGGVAITTFDTLGRAEPTLRKVHDLACVVVDEAHYIKNPEAKRTTRTHAVMSRVNRAILLTGTPLENKVGEFRNLVERDTELALAAPGTGSS